MKTTLKLVGTASLALLAAAGTALAQDTAAAAPEAPQFALASETAYIFNTLLFLIGGFLVMWMAAVSPCSRPAWCVRRTFPCSA